MRPNTSTAGSAPGHRRAVLLSARQAGRAGYNLTTMIATIARTTATSTTMPARRATLRPGAFISQGASVSAGWPPTNARNWLVLAEVSGAARNSPVVMGRRGPSSGSDMGTTVADGARPNRAVSADPGEIVRGRPGYWPVSGGTMSGLLTSLDKTMTLR